MDNAFVHVGKGGKWSGKETKFLRGIPGYSKSSSRTLPCFLLKLEERRERREGGSSSSPERTLFSHAFVVFSSHVRESLRIPRSLQYVLHPILSVFFAKLIQNLSFLSRHHVQRFPTPSVNRVPLRHVERNPSGDVPSSRRDQIRGDHTGAGSEGVWESSGELKVPSSWLSSAKRRKGGREGSEVSSERGLTSFVPFDSFLGWIGSSLSRSYVLYERWTWWGRVSR